MTSLAEASSLYAERKPTISMPARGVTCSPGQLLCFCFSRSEISGRPSLGTTVVVVVIFQPREDLAPHHVLRLPCVEKVSVAVVQGRRTRCESNDVVADVFAAQQ